MALITHRLADKSVYMCVSVCAARQGSKLYTAAKTSMKAFKSGQVKSAEGRKKKMPGYEARALVFCAHKFTLLSWVIFSVCPEL